ncbi:TPA: hypothetical protein ACGX6L_002120 [Listeria monocytogenes]
MEIYISINEEGYVDGYSLNEINPGYKIRVNEDDPFFYRGFANYKYANGKLVFDQEEEERFQLERHLREAMPSEKEQLIAAQEALVSVYEQNVNMQQQLIDMQMVMVEMFEANL